MRQLDVSLFLARTLTRKVTEVVLGQEGVATFLLLVAQNKPAHFLNAHSKQSQGSPITETDPKGPSFSVLHENSGFLLG